MLAGSLDYEETLRGGRAARGARHRRLVRASTCSRRRDPARRGRPRGPGEGRRGAEIARALPARPDVADRASTPCCAAGARSSTPRSPTRCSWRAAQDEEHLRAAALVGMRSAMVVPMVAARHASLGAITLRQRRGGRTHFDAADLELAESLASRAATAVENARLYARARRSRSTLQASLLPPALPDVPGFELAAALPRRRRGLRGRRRLLRRLHHRRGPVVRGGRRRLRQGRRGGRGDRDGALHDPRRGGAAALAGGDPAAARRGDAAPGVARAGGRFCTIACLHLDLSRHAGARHRGLRRAPAAGGPARRRLGRGARRARHAARARRATRSCRTAAASCTPATRSCSTRTGSPRRARPTRVWTPRGPRRRCCAARPGRRRGRGRGPPRARGARRAAGAPRDDIAVVALRARR